MKYIFLFFLVVLFTGCNLNKNYRLIWEDRFEGESLNPDVWNIDLGNGCPKLCGWGNNEAQIYTKKNHRLENGMLIISARKEGQQYTSTRINTKGNTQIRYGRFEMRAKLPKGRGVWPAFWMLGSNIDSVGWPGCGEIDILEYVGKTPGSVFTSLHTPSNHGSNAISVISPITHIEEGFHEFVLEWTPEKLSFYVDDALLYSYTPKNKNDQTWPFDQTFYMIVNLAVGGQLGGPEIDDSIFPQEFIIDYIRIYKM